MALLTQLSVPMRGLAALLIYRCQAAHVKACYLDAAKELVTSQQTLQRCWQWCIVRASWPLQRPVYARSHTRDFARKPQAADAPAAATASRNSAAAADDD
jgi:hypothetical protein